MSDDNNVEEPRTRKRSKGRRRFAAELAELKGRVETAINLLEQAVTEPADVGTALTRVAIRTLMGG